MTNEPPPPLVVDLDGTLVREDMLVESIRYWMSRSFFKTLLGVSMIVRSKVKMKERLAKDFEFSPEKLNYREEVLEKIRKTKEGGGKVFLSTGSVGSIAEPIADYVGVFSEIFHSCGRYNNTGKRKARALASRFGVHGFDYIGNSKSDVAVWKLARHAYFVGESPRVMSVFWTLSNAVDIRNENL